MRNFISSTLPIWAAAAVLTGAAPSTKLDCSVASLQPTLTGLGANVTKTTVYKAGAFQIGDNSNKVEFCAVEASLKYGNNDQLLFNVWLPESAEYKRRFMAVGNGGLAGTIDYFNMLQQINADLGFVVAGGNAGHRDTDNNGGAGKPGVNLPFLHDQDQVEAWIHNAVSLFTPAAKGLAEAYYGAAASYAYYDGCSTGGAQGFALAQFHPDLFNGIVAGSPGNLYSRLALSFLWNAKYTKAPASALPQATLSAITDAVLKACDEIDGVKDGLIENPEACQFSIESLACTNKAANASTCLSDAQLTAVRAIYDGPRSACGGDVLYPGFSFGSEAEWSLQQGPLANLFSIPILQNLVFNDLSYNADIFDWENDVELVDQRAGKYIDEVGPDFSKYQAHGGKLLVTQGWADPFNGGSWPIDNLFQVEEFFGGSVADWYRLFMVPGGGHCGPAQHYPAVPAVYQTVSRLVDWVEQGTAPHYIVSTTPPDGSNTTRRLCPWPQTAKYSQGDVKDWKSYGCQ